MVENGNLAKIVSETIVIINNNNGICAGLLRGIIDDMGHAGFLRKRHRFNR